MGIKEQLQAELGKWTVKSEQANKEMKSLEQSFLEKRGKGINFPSWVLTEERMTTYKRVVGEKAVAENKCREIEHKLQTLSE